MKTFLAIATGFLLVAAPARAEDPGIVPMKIVLGQTVPLTPAPVRTLICDDTSLVAPVDTPAGPALLGKALGTTICSYTDAYSMRKVCRVTVVPPSGGSPQGGSGPATGE